MRGTLSRAGTILVVLVYLCACLTPAQAQETTLAIRPLRDGGGIEHGLNTRLTTALVRFLTDHAPKSVSVLVNVGVNSTPGYLLEGGLSFTSGADEQNARFLLVTRLYRDSASRVLIGQWAGTADSLRSLTVNLRRDPRVNALGLVGEMGSRIIACLSADSVTVRARWQRLLPRLSAPTAFMEIVSAEDKARSLRQIAVGNSFRLRARQDVSCRAYLLLRDLVNGLHLARLSEKEECWTFRNGQPALSQPMTLPEGTAEAWVVSCGLSASSAHPSLCSLQADVPPVQMLDGVGNQDSHSEPAPALKQLLDEIARAPEAWRVQKLRILETK